MEIEAVPVGKRQTIIPTGSAARYQPAKPELRNEANREPGITSLEQVEAYLHNVSMSSAPATD
jgi:hypothetical protein